jgi:hypothetical protein
MEFKIAQDKVNMLNKELNDSIDTKDRLEKQYEEC